MKFADRLSDAFLNGEKLTDEETALLIRLHVNALCYCEIMLHQLQLPDITPELKQVADQTVISYLRTILADADKSFEYHSRQESELPANLTRKLSEGS